MTETKTKPFDPDVDPFDIERVEGVGCDGEDGVVAWSAPGRDVGDNGICAGDDGLWMWVQSIFGFASTVNLPPNLPHNAVLSIMRANGWEG